MHLAQLNVAKLRYPIDDPRVAGFAENLGLVNGIAEASEGFVWRLIEDGSDDATGILAFDDPMAIVNLSVWRDAESLEHFVWNTVHKRFYRMRAEWFDAMDRQHLAMWWVEKGHRPTLAEAAERLESLHAKGDTDFAFGWAHLPHVKLWQEARCA